jgi:hypothetical protein
VSGAHLKSDGSIFEGSYNLSIRSSLARCIYKFTAAPISATISVVNSEGENKVSTTTFNETKSGWINFTAAGFTFSSPTIKVRITQEKEILPTPSPSPTMKTPVLKTIKCQKKKTVKKVSGTSPACPAGYKKIS